MWRQACGGTTQPWAWLELAAFMLELEVREAAALVALLVPAAGPLLTGGGNASCSDRAGAMGAMSSSCSAAWRGAATDLNW